MRTSHAILLVGIAVALVLQQTGIVAAGFPEALEIPIDKVVDSGADWVAEELRPVTSVISAGVKAFIAQLDQIMLAIPWPVFLLAGLTFSVAVSGWGLGLSVFFGLFALGSIGLWESSIVTLNIMMVSVFASVAIGVPLGIWAATNDRVDTVVRPIMDIMQTLPTFVYLVPVMLLFGLGATSAITATVIYALPPMARMTNLGLRQVPASAIEAADSLGSTPRQRLFKVTLPLARPSIMMGLNQTIMMALSMAIFVALIGSAGLGRDVWYAMRRLNIGTALEAGLAVVLLAILLDRVSAAVRPAYARASQQRSGGKSDFSARLRLPRVLAAIFVVGSIVTVLVHAFVFDLRDFPQALQFHFAEPANVAVRWINVHLSDISAVFRDITLIYGLLPLKALLTWVSWPVLIGVIVYLSWLTGGRRLVALAVFGFLFIGVSGMWEDTMVTLSQVIVALAITFAWGLPLGVIASQHNGFAAALRPFMDMMQTLPPFVYFPVIVFLFQIGQFSGILATVLYAISPVIRLTNLGIRNVSANVVEASISSGATTFQTLTRVQIPLALPSITVGINQSTMMALAMVVYAALIGAPGLGAVVLSSIGRFDIGTGFEAGMCIVILAMLFDRMIDSVAKRRAGYSEALAS